MRAPLLWAARASRLEKEPRKLIPPPDLAWPGALGRVMDLSYTQRRGRDSGHIIFGTLQVIGSLWLSAPGQLRGKPGTGKARP
jgi:hypothetical protein